jgi:hypothetical protein
MPKEQESSAGSISLGRQIRGQKFVWIGIVGSTLIIADFLSDFITVVDWGDWLIGNWKVYFRGFWIFIGNILGAGITEEVSRSLSLLFFVSSVTLYTSRQPKMVKEVREYSNKFIQAYGFVLFVLCWSVLWFVLEIGAADAGYHTQGYGKHIFISVVVLVYSLVYKKSPVLRTYLCLVYFLFLSIILRPWMNDPSLDNINELFLSIALAFLFFGPMFIEGNTRFLTVRLTFIVVGVAIIFGLSEVSKQVERLRGAAATVEAR